MNIHPQRCIFFDVSALLRDHARLSGVERIQAQLASVVSDSTASAKFCRFDASRDIFVSVEPGEVIAAVDRMSDGYAGRRENSLGSAITGRFRKRFRRVLSLPPLSVIAAWKRSFTQMRSQRLCVSSSWGPGTTYVSVGMDERDNNLHRLARLRKRLNFEVVVTVFDTIPFTVPQLQGAKSDLLLTVIETADLLFVISDSTKNDVSTVAKEHAIRLPHVVKLPMPSSLCQYPTPHDAPERDGRCVVPQSFVLCVGTITARKNHHLLLDVWERLIARHGAAAPQLVIAGKNGWLNAETLARMRLTPQFAGVVEHFEDLSDSELAWLYENCAFTVMASLYEGWGYPVSESLDFGKACIASDRASLVEAGAGLCVHLDPVDRNAWTKAVERLWFDLDYRDVLERRIGSEYSVIEDSDLARVVEDALRLQ